MNPGRRQLFAYWHVSAAALDAALAAVRRWQDELRSNHPALVVGLLIRRDADQAQATAMETYAINGGAGFAGIDAELERQIVEQGEIGRASCRERV